MIGAGSQLHNFSVFLGEGTSAERAAVGDGAGVADAQSLDVLSLLEVDDIGDFGSGVFSLYLLAISVEQERAVVDLICWILLIERALDVDVARIGIAYGLALVVSLVGQRAEDVLAIGGDDGVLIGGSLLHVDGDDGGVRLVHGILLAVVALDVVLHAVGPYHRLVDGDDGVLLSSTCLGLHHRSVLVDIVDGVLVEVLLGGGDVQVVNTDRAVAVGAVVGDDDLGDIHLHAFQISRVGDVLKALLTRLIHHIERYCAQSMSFEGNLRCIVLLCGV